MVLIVLISMVLIFLQVLLLLIGIKELKMEILFHMVRILSYLHGLKQKMLTM